MFVQQYAIIEFSVTEILLGALQHPAYDKLGKLRADWPSKVKRLGQVLDASGPLSPFAGRCRQQLGVITMIETHRHLLVHGVLTVYEQAGVPTFNCKMHDAWKLVTSELTAPIDDLRYIAVELAVKARAFTTLTLAMLEAGGFPAVRLGTPRILDMVKRKF